MMATAMRELPSDARASYELSAAEEITPFASRMTPDARTTAVQSALERLVREGFGLPTLTFE